MKQLSKAQAELIRTTEAWRRMTIKQRTLLQKEQEHWFMPPVEYVVGLEMTPRLDEPCELTVEGAMALVPADGKSVQRSK